MQGRRPVGYIPGHDVRQCGNMNGLPWPCEHVRQFATAGENKGETEGSKAVLEDGPLKEYEDRIAQGRLRSDPYQRRRCHGLGLVISVGDS